MSVSVMSIFKVTADDFGYCKERNRGILKSVKAGAVNSVSVLVNGNALEKTDVPYTVGLHLNLSEGSPCCTLTNVSTLVTCNGVFHDKMSIVDLAEKGLIDGKQVRQEIESQILKFKIVFNRYPDYIDGHQHVHILPIIRDELVNMMKKYEINETRVPFEHEIDKCTWIEPSRLQFYKQVCKNAVAARQIFADGNIRYPKHFIGLSTMSHDFTIERISSALKVIKQILETDDEITAHHHHNAPFVEIMTHPGYINQNEIGGCGALGPDEFSRSKDRENEMNVLISSSFHCLLKKFKLQFQAYLSQGVN